MIEQSGESHTKEEAKDNGSRKEEIKNAWVDKLKKYIDKKNEAKAA